MYIIVISRENGSQDALADIVGAFSGNKWVDAIHEYIRWCIQKYPDWVDSEINNNNNKQSLRSKTKGYGGKTHYTDSQNSDTTTPSGRELYRLQFSLQVVSPETFGYTTVYICCI
jgi:hypothetical protein